MKIKGLIKKYYPFIISVIVILLIIILINQNKFLKKQFSNVSKFSQTSSFVNVTSPTVFGNSFILQKWNGGTSYSTLSTGNSGDSTKIPTTNVPNYNIIPASSWSWFDSTGVTSSTAKFLGIVVSGTNWFVNIATTATPGISFAEYSVSFSTTTGTLFNVVTQSERSTPLTFGSNIYNNNYLYKEKDSSSKFLCVSTDATGAILKCASPNENNTTVLTYNFRMTDNSIQNVNTISGTVTYSSTFNLGIWNGPGSNPEWNSLSAQTQVDASGQYKPTLDKATPDEWAWASDSNTDDYSKYLAIQLGGTTWNYITFDPGSAKVTFSTTQGTLFNVVNSTGDRTTPKNIINSIDYQNYLYRVKGLAVETYLAISTDATGNLLKVVTIGSGDIKSYNFKMSLISSSSIQNVNTLSRETITYSSSFILSIWNGPGSNPEWDTLGPGAADASGQYKPTLNNRYESLWTWVSDSNTNDYSKYLGLSINASVKCLIFDPTNGKVTFSSTQGTLFNVVTQEDRSTPLNIINTLYKFETNLNYLYKVKGQAVETYLAISTDATGNLLKVVAMGSGDIKSYNFKMRNLLSDIQDISGTVTYSSTFNLGIWNGPGSNPEWNILSDGAADASGQYKPTLDKATPDQWAWASDSNTNDYSKYLALRVGGTTWKYIIFDRSNDSVSFSTTQGALFYVVTQEDRTTPKNIISSIDNQNYLYRVNTSISSDSTYLAITTNATGNLLKVVIMGDIDIKSYNFKMFTLSPAAPTTAAPTTTAPTQSNFTYSSFFWLGKWNGKYNTPEYNILSAGVADSSGNYLPQYDKPTSTQWAWASDSSGVTTWKAKYLALRVGGATWKYVTFDSATGIVSLNNTPGTLFNVVSQGAISTPLDILSTINNNNYLFLVANSEIYNELYLAITKDDTLRIVAMNTANIQTYNFKMFTSQPEQTLFSYSKPFILNMKINGVWSTISAGRNDTNGDFIPIVDKPVPDQWAWVSAKNDYYPTYGSNGYYGLAVYDSNNRTWKFLNMTFTKNTFTWLNSTYITYYYISSDNTYLIQYEKSFNIDQYYDVNFGIITNSSSGLFLWLKTIDDKIKVLSYQDNANIYDKQFKISMSNQLPPPPPPPSGTADSYTKSFWLSKWNGDQKDNYPKYNILDINSSGTLIYTNNRDSLNWAWADVSGSTDKYKKYLVININGNWKYICNDISGNVYLSSNINDGILFNIVNSTGNDKTTPLDIETILNNNNSNNYLYKVNGSTKYLYVSKNDNLRVNNIGISDTSTYTFKMDYTTKPIVPTFTYSDPFILNLKVNGVWSTVSAGESDTDGNFTYVLNKSPPDQWAWVKSNQYVKSPLSSYNYNSGLAVNINGIWKHVIVTSYNSKIYLSSSFRTHLAIWQPGNVYLSADQLLNSPSLYFNKDVSIMFDDFIYQNQAVLNIDDNNKHIYGIQYSARTDNMAYIFKMTAI